MLSLPSSGSAGQVVYKNMYSGHDLVQGIGKTVAEANQDAKAAIPPQFKVDPLDSATLECSVSDAQNLPGEGTECDPKSPGNRV